MKFYLKINIFIFLNLSFKLLIFNSITIELIACNINHYNNLIYFILVEFDILSIHFII